MVSNVIRRTLSTIFFALLIAPAFFPGRALQSAPGEAAQNYSKEPFVVESDVTRITFENDGTSNHENVVRVRVQSQAGLQSFGIIHVPYPSANAAVEIVSMKVFKADGRVVVTPAGNVMDMPAAVTQTAPLYSDLHDKQVPVKGLEIGDVLEYDIKIRFHTPLVPGHFWYAHNFNHSGIVLAAELDISVPRDRAVKVASANLQPTTSEDAARRMYTWRTSNLDRKASDAAARAQSPLHIPPPSVQITTFRNWNEIAQWYHGLEEPAVQASAEIKSLVEKLTQGATSRDEKIHILYNYVATKIRYVGLDFGIGRYQPHAAADVLENEYGDCKDKHTLLASMLSVIGVKSYPALVNSEREIDPEIPSPAQFDHVITVVPNEKSATWLDTTAEVSPFGVITLNLRDRNSLPVTGQSPMELVKIPADSPVPTSMDFKITGKLDASGTLQANIQIGFRGDFEVIFRQVFRAIPQPQWQEGVHGLSTAWGFGGSVSDVSISSPESTDEPFRISYSYLRKEFGDWPTKRIVAAFPQPIIIPVRDDKEFANVPVELGPLGEITMQGEIELPDGYSMATPNPGEFTRKNDFADYRSEYSVAGNTFKFTRHVATTIQELPASRRAEFIAFRKVLDGDESRFFPLNDHRLTGPSLAKNPEALKLYQKAYTAFQIRQFPSAIDLANQALALEPDYPLPYRVIALSLMASGKGDAALEPFRKLEKMIPNDPTAAYNIGAILLAKNQPADAIPDLESAVKWFPDNSGIAIELGQAYIRSGSVDKGVIFLNATAKLDPSPLVLNNIAYELAEQNIDLDNALKYSEKSVEEVENQSSELDTDNPTAEDWQTTSFLQSFWDTLGWVHYRLNHFDQAEKYLRAAWTFDHGGLAGDHLAQVYEKEGKKQDAIHIYALAAAEGNVGTPQALKKVQRLVGNDLKGDDIVIAAKAESGRLNIVKVPRTVKGTANAEFYVVFTQDIAEPEARYMNGSEGLREAGKGIEAAKFDVRFPDGRPAKVIRSGFISCTATGTTCDFSFIPPGLARVEH
jgi:tetratricopeptide (TPR) repeat protein